MNYWETDEYKADQAAFEAGLTPEEHFAIAQKWGIEAKVAATRRKYHRKTREAYLYLSLVHYCAQWRGLGGWLEDWLVGKAMELGCGVASFLEIVPSVTEALAVDPALQTYAQRLPDKARLGQHGKVFYVSGVIQDIKNEDFDVVFSHNAIDHGVDWQDIIYHIRRVLKVGGSLLLAVHVCDKPRTGYHRRLTHPSHFSIEALNEELAFNRFEMMWQSPIPEPRPPVWFSYTWATKGK